MLPLHWTSLAGANDLIERATSEPDLNKRKALYGDLPPKISEDSPAAFLVTTSSHLLINNRITQIPGASWPNRYDWFSITVPAA